MRCSLFYMPRCGPKNANFILRQLKEKYLTKWGNLPFAFVDLEKAIARVETTQRRVAG